MSDEDNCLNLVRNPAPEGAEVRANWDHMATAGVCGLTFPCDGRRLRFLPGVRALSSGGAVMDPNAETTSIPCCYRLGATLISPRSIYY